MGSGNLAAGPSQQPPESGWTILELGSHIIGLGLTADGFALAMQCKTALENESESLISYQPFPLISYCLKTEYGILRKILKV